MKKKCEFENLLDELNQHIHTFIQYETAKENYTKVIEQMKDAWYSNIDNDRSTFTEFGKHFNLKYTSVYLVESSKKQHVYHHIDEMFYKPYKLKNLFKMIKFLTYGDEGDSDMLIKYVFNFCEYWSTKYIKNLIIDNNGVITQMPIKHGYIMNKSGNFYVAN